MEPSGHRFGGARQFIGFAKFVAAPERSSRVAAAAAEPRLRRHCLLEPNAKLPVHALYRCPCAQKDTTRAQAHDPNACRTRSSSCPRPSPLAGPTDRSPRRPPTPTQQRSQDIFLQKNNTYGGRAKGVDCAENQVRAVNGHAQHIALESVVRATFGQQAHP